MNLYIDEKESTLETIVLLVPSKTYYIKDITSPNYCEEVSGKTLISQLTQDLKAKRPFRYRNAISKRSYATLNTDKVSNKDSLGDFRFSRKGVVHSDLDVDLRFVEHSGCKLAILKFLGELYVTIDISEPEPQQDNISIISFKFGSFRETFSYYNSGADFVFNFKNISYKDGTLYFKFSVSFPTELGIKEAVISNVSVSETGINYRDVVMGYCDDLKITKHLTLRRTGNDGILLR